MASYSPNIGIVGPPDLQPPPALDQQAAATRPKNWWQRFLGSGFALPAIGGVVGAAGLATGSPTLQAAGFGFGGGAAEEGVRQYRERGEEASRMRQRRFEEGQLRLRNLSEDLAKKRNLVQFVKPLEDPALEEQRLRATQVLSAFDQATQKDGGPSDAEVKRVLHDMAGIDWEALSAEKQAQTGVRMAEAEGRAKREVAVQQRIKDLGTAQDVGGFARPSVPTVMGLSSPEDWRREAERSVGQQELNKAAAAEVYPYEVRPGITVKASPGEMISGENQKRLAAASVEAARRGESAQSIALEREERLREDADLSRRRQEWQSRHEAWAKGGTGMMPGFNRRGQPEPHSPDEINDMLEQFGEQLRALPPDQLDRKLKQILPDPSDRTYAKNRLTRRGLRPPPK